MRKITKEELLEQLNRIEGDLEIEVKVVLRHQTKDNFEIDRLIAFPKPTLVIIEK